MQVIIVTGGETDIAYANGKRDFETLPARVPVFYGGISGRTFSLFRFGH